MSAASPPPFACTIRVPPPSGLELAVDKQAYWGPEFTELTTSFLDTNDRAVIDEIILHLNTWPGRLKFVWTQQSDAVVRITTGSGGFWGYIGKGALMVPRGQPTMNLQWEWLRNSASERARVIPHEGGHLRGYWHEHLREDIVRDINPALAYPDYAREQGWGRAMVDANVLTPVSEASIMGTPIDGHSIMCYPIKPSITYSGRGYPGGVELSDSDIAFDLKIYPWPVVEPPPTPPPPPPPPPPPVEPPKPEPPPVKPPEPAKPEEFGPYELKVGAESDRFTYIPGTSVLFRFKAPRKGNYVAAVRGTPDLKMDLLDAKKAILKSDDDSGKGANPLIAAPLKKATYYLRISASDPEARGTYRVKVVSL